MSQKEQIINLLKEKQIMTQADFSIALYGDNKHLPNVYASLMSLVDKGVVLRSGSNPSYYSLTDKDFSFSKVENYIKINKKKEIKVVEITNDSLEHVHETVLKTENYGQEDKLITDCLKKYPLNNDIPTVAMKIGLIDITNSTHVSQHKSLISVVELAECIVNINDIDNRIKNGDPEVVNEIAKCNGRINLFSFATKYCCYHNKNLYGRDDYSILDTVLKESLPKYFDDITKSMIQRWQDSYDYKTYNDYISKKLDELKINVSFRKRKFDHLIWYTNR